MDERTFDGLLRRALMDANLERFRDVLDGADGLDPAFSSRYLRQRMKLLADPFGWVGKTVRPLWKKVLRNAACLLLACTLALGALLAASPTVRAAVLNWLREIGGSLITYSAPDRSRGPALQLAARLAAGGLEPGIPVAQQLEIPGGGRARLADLCLLHARRRPVDHQCRRRGRRGVRAKHRSGSGNQRRLLPVGGIPDAGVGE